MHKAIDTTPQASEAPEWLAMPVGENLIVEDLITSTGASARIAVDAFMHTDESRLGESRNILVVASPWLHGGGSDEDLLCSCCTDGESHASHDERDTIDNSIHGERE